jgi:hypothetical protein
MWDDSSQVTTEGLNRPCLVAVVFTPSPPVGVQVINQVLVLNAHMDASAGSTRREDWLVIKSISGPVRLQGPTGFLTL